MHTTPTRLLTVAAIAAGAALLGAGLKRRLTAIPREQRTATHVHASSNRLHMKGRRAADYAEKLEQSHAQLRELSAALQTIREEERTHIARELHDDLGQLLATLRVDLNLLQQQTIDNTSAQQLLDSMDKLLLTAITSLRRIASNLRPRALDEGGLYFALESLRHEFSQRHGIASTLMADEEELILNDVYSTAIFRIVQEAMTNIARHAGAHSVQLLLRRSGRSLHLTIQDDGRGIAEQDMDKAESFGLIGMRERVWALHGDISIVSDGGTRIAIRLPLPPD
jgi:signal transduction histidine kinase